MLNKIPFFIRKLTKFHEKFYYYKSLNSLEISSLLKNILDMNGVFKTRIPLIFKRKLKLTYVFLLYLEGISK
jgi:hypothetical protein